jgi:hypothetical protein
MITVRELQSKIAKEEGKKHQATIGDVREVLKITFTELSKLTVVELTSLLKKYAKKSTQKTT